MLLTVTQLLSCGVPALACQDGLGGRAPSVAFLLGGLSRGFTSFSRFGSLRRMVIERFGHDSSSSELFAHLKTFDQVENLGRARMKPGDTTYHVPLELAALTLILAIYPPFILLSPVSMMMAALQVSLHSACVWHL